jgi:hemerythrin-like domain-containing protein
VTSEDPRANFTYFSTEYAQALQALTALENQSSTLLLLGNHDELRQFIEQFLTMANRVKAEAEEKNEPNFAEWFTELIARAEALRGEIARR